MFVLLLLAPAAIELRFMPDPPTLNTGTHRLNKSDNLELTCRCVYICTSLDFLHDTPTPEHIFYLSVPFARRGRQYLTWSIPPTSTHFSISDCSGAGLFCTMLRISNATVNETGQYQCFYRDLKVEDGKTSVSAYVFVHGITHYKHIYTGSLWCMYISPSSFH